MRVKYTHIDYGFETSNDANYTITSDRQRTRKKASRCFVRMRPSERLQQIVIYRAGSRKKKKQRATDDSCRLDS